MAGGRPGGLYAANARIATIYAIVKQVGEVSLRLDPGSAMYLHDGRGTAVPLTRAEGSLMVASDLLLGIPINSSSHPTPESWNREGRIEFFWGSEAGKEYSYRLSTDPKEVPDDRPDSGNGVLTFLNVADGIWYFTIKERTVGQREWSPVTQRRFLLDKTPPEPFQLNHPAPNRIGGQSVITWVAIDRTSDIAEERLVVDGRVRQAVNSPVHVEESIIGHRIQIHATDAAGNVRLSQAVQLGNRNPGWWLIVALIVGGVMLMLVVAMIRRR